MECALGWSGGCRGERYFKSVTDDQMKFILQVSKISDLKSSSGVNTSKFVKRRNQCSVTGGRLYRVKQENTERIYKMGDIILTVVPVVSLNKPNKARFECRVNLSFKTKCCATFWLSLHHVSCSLTRNRGRSAFLNVTPSAENCHHSIRCKNLSMWSGNLKSQAVLTKHSHLQHQKSSPKSKSAFQLLLSMISSVTRGSTVILASLSTSYHGR